MRKLLNTDEQIAKLNAATKLANDSCISQSVAERLGAFVIYAGITDFLVIQAARLVEQIMLKGQLAAGEEPSFHPHDDKYFYDQRVSTRRILRGIRKLLPFSVPDARDVDEAARITELANDMIDKGFNFLNFRNPIVHQIGSPNNDFNDLFVLTDKAISAFHTFQESHTVFFEAAAPFRFSDAELRRFYG